MTREQFIELVAQEQKPLRRFLCALCGGDSSMADDLAQEALLKAYLSFGKFEGRSRFSTWLFRIAYNCFCDSRKASGKCPTEPITFAEEQRADSTADASSRFSHQDLYLAMERLSEAEKAVTLLFYMEDKSIRDIEAITGIPSGTVRSHLSRARQHLRKYMEETKYGI